MKHKIPERIKLTIAYVIDKVNPDVCWCDLVLWAMDIHTWGEIDWHGKCKPGGRGFSEPWGGCYCGKNQAIDGGCAVEQRMTDNENHN